MIIQGYDIAEMNEHLFQLKTAALKSDERK